MATELSDAIDFVIIQAFSQGMSSQNIYSNKLHSLILGAPASGKKLISRCALALTANGKSVSSTSSKVTAAGLIGSARKTKTGYISQPGILPAANNGVVCFEDFHEIAKDKNELSSILSKVMEDGKVEDSSSAKTTHLACTSINIDMNRLSQLNQSGSYNSYNDINIPLNIISRFDFIVDIPPDVERQMQVSLEMVGRFQELVSEEPTFKQSDRENRLKQIVAVVNSQHRKLRVPSKVTTYIRGKLEELYKTNESSSELQKHLGSMLTRLQNSIEKLTKAIATSKLHTKATVEDVDEAFYFLSYKFKFLSDLGFMVSPKSNRSDKINRIQHIIQHFKDKEFSIKDVMEFVNSAGTAKVEERTIRRDITSIKNLKKLIKLRQGLYTILE